MKIGEDSSKGTKFLFFAEWSLYKLSKAQYLQWQTLELKLEIFKCNCLWEMRPRLRNGDWEGEFLSFTLIFNLFCYIYYNIYQKDETEGHSTRPALENFGRLGDLICISAPVPQIGHKVRHM